MSQLQDQKNAFYNRAMCHLRAGVYSRDYNAPESMDLPEVCAFSRYGLLELIDFKCSEDLRVVQDVRFGVIPVCTNHRKHVIKQEVGSEEKRTRTWLGDYTPNGTPYYFDSGSGHVIAGGDEWGHR